MSKPLPKQIDKLLCEAVEMQGTDLHISVGSAPRVRIFGSLKEMDYDIIQPADAKEYCFSLLDALAKTQLTDKGQLDLSHSIRNVGRFRVNLFRQKGDYAAVFRLLNEKPKDYTKLGIPTGFFSLTNRRRGLVLVVGPTGSGKSTTLASFMHYINQSKEKHIITLEDPIEYVHWHEKCLVNQREIGTDCSDFADGLRAALREDPDVILVGEMRDLESIQTALQAAETGHLVCSTLHTLGAAETINRVIDMYPERMHTQVRSQLCAVLEGVCSQQLMPNADDNGYVVTYEILYKNKEIKQLIKENRIDEITEYLKTPEAIRQGMCSMDDTIYKLFTQGKITRNTALDFAFDRKSLQAKIDSNGDNLLYKKR